jgi:acyl dehydratase
MTGDMVYFEDFPVGHVEESPEVVASREEMLAYARANDPWPVHVDEEFAAASPFGGLIASFGYVVSLFFRGIHALPVNQASGEGFLAAVGWEVRFRNAVRPGDRLRIRMTISGKRPSSKPGRGLITTRNEVLGSQDDVKVQIDITSLYRNRP